MEKQFNFKTSEIEKELKNCKSKGITELYIHDDKFASDKSGILKLLRTAEKDAPELFISFKVEPQSLDMEIIQEALNVNCSIEMDFKSSEKGFDKKLFSKKCALLNNAGLVFGVNLFYAENSRDSLKLFKDRLDFTIKQYPNHVDFPQIEGEAGTDGAKVTGLFSAIDIRQARNISFAVRTFYSSGRAVPWFNSVLLALKISAVNFFQDFSEWQKVNNCDWKSGFVPENSTHEEIEKMQLLFLSLKLEEKNAKGLSIAVNDVVRLNGAMSRLVAEGIESTVETEYNPDDIFGPESMDLISFEKDVCMEKCSVKLFINDSGEPDYRLF